MGCEFEFILAGKDDYYLRCAAEEAFEEVARLEEQLSVFVSDSEVSYINACAPHKWVRVEPRLYELLKECARLSEDTEGAFDVTSGALVSLWNSSVDRIPSEKEIRSVLEDVGMGHVLFDDEENAVRFAVEGLRINLGGVGKGFAARQIADTLECRGVHTALISAGPSTVLAIGSPPDEESWSIGIKNPLAREERITSVRLRDRALSTSGSHERFVEIDGVRYSHVIDPRTGFPAEGMLTSSVLTSDPVASDALSTAFFILGEEGTRQYCKDHPSVGALLVYQEKQDSAPAVFNVNMD